MSLADELLENLPENPLKVSEADSYFTIDPVTRTMSNGSGVKNVIMQGDHDSVTYTFKLPRMIDGHNILQCNRVTVHWNNVGTRIDAEYEEPEEVAESTDITDLRINPHDDSTVICSWTISRNSTQLAGILSFLVEYKRVEGEETIYEWHTDIYSNVEIRSGRNNGMQSVMAYTDIIEQWRNRLFGAGNTVMSDIAAAGEDQKDSIEAKGRATLATIPDDYTATHNLAKSATRTRANAIVITAEGESIVAEDCSDDYLRGLHIYGRTIQDGTPTPDNPIELVSVENPVVELCGKNLLNPEYVNTNPSYADMYSSVLSTTKYKVEKGKTYTLSFDTENTGKMLYVDPSSGFTFEQFHMDGTRKSFTKTMVDTIDSNSPLALVSIGEETDVACGEMTNVQLTMVESSDYEPYKPVQSVTFNRTLPGIPVETGGNCTDSNGQQWICDEIDFERGVYVRRVAHHIFDGSSDEAWSTYDSFNGAYMLSDLDRGSDQYATPMFCNYALRKSWGTGSQDKHYCFINGYEDFVIGGSEVKNLYPTLDLWKAQISTTPCEVLYRLATPIETPLTEEELFAFSNLRSNSLVTTVLNSESAYMGLVYNADTKAYFEGRFNALLNTLRESGHIA